MPSKSKILRFTPLVLLSTLLLSYAAPAHAGLWDWVPAFLQSKPVLEPDPDFLEGKRARTLLWKEAEALFGPKDSFFHDQDSVKNAIVVLEGKVFIDPEFHKDPFQYWKDWKRNVSWYQGDFELLREVKRHGHLVELAELVQAEYLPEDEDFRHLSYKWSTLGARIKLRRSLLSYYSENQYLFERIDVTADAFLEHLRANFFSHPLYQNKPDRYLAHCGSALGMIDRGWSLHLRFKGLPKSLEELACDWAQKTLDGYGGIKLGTVKRANFAAKGDEVLWPWDELTRSSILEEIKHRLGKHPFLHVDSKAVFEFLENRVFSDPKFLQDPISYSQRWDAIVLTSDRQEDQVEFGAYYFLRHWVSPIKTGKTSRVDRLKLAGLDSHPDARLVSSEFPARERKWVLDLLNAHLSDIPNLAVRNKVLQLLITRVFSNDLFLTRPVEFMKGERHCYGDLSYRNLGVLPHQSYETYEEREILLEACQFMDRFSRSSEEHLKDFAARFQRSRLAWDFF